MQKYDVILDNVNYHVDIRNGDFPLVNGKPCPADIRKLGSHRFSVVLEGVSRTILAAQVDGGYDVFLGGEYHRVLVETEKGRLLKRHATAASGKAHRAEVHAPMPALVVKVEVATGDAVSEGQGLIILEAMKMENELKAHQSGTVKSVLVEKGRAVEKGELLIVLE